DLTRHTYGRQWWRSVQLADDPDLVERLGEADLNQITERANTIGANPRLMALPLPECVARRSVGWARTTTASRVLRCEDEGSLRLPRPPQDPFCSLRPSPPPPPAARSNSV